ncbi:MAG: FtsX-like permease family protein [Acidobacteriota bacterium]
MKYLPLLLTNLLRRKTRTMLTIGSYVVALFLFGFLVGIRESLLGGMELGSAERLGVINKTSLINPLPLSYGEKLLSIPGITGCTHMSWFGGVYVDEKNFFPQFAIDPATYLALFPEFKVPADQWKALCEDKAGCIAGKKTAARFHWTIGQKIPIQGGIFPGLWEFKLRGIYEGTRKEDDESQFWFRWDYLDESVPPDQKSYVGWYTVRVQHPDAAVALAKKIDEMFANSAWPTHTQTEKAMAASFINEIGNIGFLLTSVGTVVFFTLLLVTGNTMATAVRERTRELAVMKTLGFTDATVMALVLLESLVVAILGGGAGLVLAERLTTVDITAGKLPPLFIPPSALASGVALTLAMGLLAGALPAVLAMRLKVVDALRRV